MYLFFDTETTGLPKNYKTPVSDLNNWPRMVQIAWLMYNKDGNLMAQENHVIKPVGFTIPVAASTLHGVTTKKAQESGADLASVLTNFADHIAGSQYLIAHNIGFDKNIVGAEFLRNRMKNAILGKTLLCTMESGKNHCAIRTSYGLKSPRLTELHYKLFGRSFDGAHNALTDITMTAKCFWEMRKKGLI